MKLRHASPSVKSKIHPVVFWSIHFLLFLSLSPWFLGAILYIALFTGLPLLHGTIALELYFVLFLLGGSILVVLMYLATRWWQAVLVSAGMLRRGERGLAVARLHLRVIRRFLSRSFEGLEQDLLDVALKGDISEGDSGPRGNVVARVLHATLIDLTERVLFLEGETAGAKIENYQERLSDTFKEAATAHSATIGFLAANFRQLDERVKSRARTWIPPRTLIERIEAHGVGVQAIITLSGFVVIISVALAIHLYAGLP